MFDKLKMKFAARRVKANKKSNKGKTARKNTKRKGFWARVWNIICWPFRMIAKLCKRFWNWLCGINLVAMVNLALLVAIIVLFSMLIIDVVGCRKQVVIVAKAQNTPEQVVVTDASAPRNVRPRPVLPIKVNAQTNKKEAPSVNVTPVNRTEAKVARQQTAKHQNKFMGDVIIDSRGAGTMLKNGSQVNGNLYLQNMRKYTLPCDIRINGNLFLRDVNMLQFCGDFVITGNIYVSPRSSFGPIPKTARLGGHVVL
ncbi:MAG: hypothetical protein ACLRFO_03560 [Alphaproteobacteria bacterium]